MIALYIIGGLLALIFVPLSIPTQVTAKYRNQLEIEIRYLFIPVFSYPQKPKGKFRKWTDEKKKYLSGKLKKIFSKKKKPKKPTAQSAPAKKKEKGPFRQLVDERGVSGMLSLLLRIVRLTFGASRGILRRITVDRFDLRITVCAEDAAETAVKYGEMCSAVFPASAIILGEVRKCRRKNITVVPDFSGGATEADAYVVFRIMPLLAIHHSLSAFIKLLWHEISEKIREKIRESRMSAAAAGET